MPFLLLHYNSSFGNIIFIALLCICSTSWERYFGRQKCHNCAQYSKTRLTHALYTFNNVPMSALAFFKVYKMYKCSDALVVINLTVISFVKIKFALMKNVIF